jgi:hypothetical protein
MMALAVLASAAVVSCPAAAHGHRLATVQVFDGPPSERADLEPDGSVWDLKAIRPTSSPKGLFLVCGYGGGGRFVSLPLPNNVGSCRRAASLSAPRVLCR